MRRRVAFVLVSMAVALLSAGGVALAANIVGTDKDETLIGTRFADTIRAKGGDDDVRGKRRADELYGNGGRDLVVGGRGADRLHGGYGNDRLVSEDIFSQTGGYIDVVDCGPGEDTYRADGDDVIRPSCERGVVFVP